MKLRLLLLLGLLLLSLIIFTNSSNQLERKLAPSLFTTSNIFKFYMPDNNQVIQGTTLAPSPQPTTDVDEGQYAGVAYLTFDDGPGKLTGEVLDILAENDITATFFVLGEQVEKYPELLERIASEGHSIGNHSYNHVYDELYNDFTNFSDQVLLTSQAIYDVTGFKTPLLRAPGGTYNNVDTSYYDAMSEAGYMMFDWNVDSGDSAGRNVTKEKIINNVKKSDLKKRVIVLMHDSNSHKATIEALPEIIAYYREQNYRFDVITETTEPMLSRITDHIRWDRKPATAKEKASFIEQVNELMSQ
ncbi:polysaccharide deacetylase family protein [Paenibacillus endoradicis]|uniref:polysaccharide deacetylase family protein n=1 Tax=Paenibacillus endoradicis TaxID=2972487 RepID=UPI002159A25F|nr:polysaccharide deacetylase family protein [Paenibacillus endoradicis]MCR8660114.1 polysaccharide deacetylase [Paenibacillus endoradicis]